MRTIEITPPKAISRAMRMAESAGWSLEPSKESGAEKAVVNTREPILVVPAHAKVSRKLSKIMVVHEGSPLVTPAMEMADEIACQSGADIVVLHVLSMKRPFTPGSLPSPRFTDNPGYAMEEWRVEFFRRFCQLSEGLQVNLEVTSGEPAVAISDAIRRIKPNLVLVTWKGKTEPGHSRVLRMLLRDSISPVLVLREPTLVRKPGTTIAPPASSG